MLHTTHIQRGMGLLMLLLLAACGGGGGGGGGGSTVPGGTGQTPPDGLVISTDKSELRFISIKPSNLAEDAITFTLAGAQTSATYYAKAEPDANSGFETYIMGSTLTSIKVGMRALTTNPSVDGAILFKLCKDEGCGSVVWSRSIPYRVRAYTVDTREVALAGFEGAVTTDTRTISPLPAAGDLRITANSSLFGDKVPNWLSGSIDGAGRLVIQGSGAGVAKGNYSGAIYVAPANTQSTGANIRVSMSLGVGVVLPAAGSVTIDASSPALVNGAMNLAFKGEQSPAWSVSSDKPWLVPTTATGTGAGTVGYSIDTTKLAALPNFTPETGELRLKIAGHPDTAYKVSVTKKLPEILAVSPAQIPAGREASLRLRGRGLQQLAAVKGITLNGTALAGGTILSDTEALVTLAPLSAGSYQLGVPSAPAIAQPRLDVVDAPSLSAAVIDSIGNKGGIVYSALRSAIYFVDRDHAKLLRYRLINNAWTLDKSLTVEPSTRVGLSQDERTLYTNNGPYILEERDAETMAVTASYEYQNKQMYGPTLIDYIGREFPITNDGRIWFGDDQWSDANYFDTRKKSFTTVVSRVDIPSSLYSPVFIVSRDGSRMLAESQYEPTLRYDPGSGKLEAAASNYATGNSNTVISGNGKYVLNGIQRLYEVDTWRLVGVLPSTYSMFGPRVLSNDGSRIYVGVRNEAATSPALVRIDVLDTATMTKLGEIPLAPAMTDCENNSGGYGCVALGSMRLTPFGDALVWFNSKKISIIPLPKTLAGSMATARFKLAK